MRKVLILMLTVFALLPAGACLADTGTGKLAATPPPGLAKTERVVISTADGKNVNVFHVELALTLEEQINGLMNRTSLPKDGGMLFVFKEPEERSFWMKDTLIPLDMLFIDSKGKIVTLHENARPKDETGIPSNAPVLAVLELPGGTAKRLGLKTGDIVRYKAFNNVSG
jgi:uncharacterized membrane protein (UPF0127 family)